jgi:hypothetical protein
LRAPSLLLRAPSLCGDDYAPVTVLPIWENLSCSGRPSRALNPELSRGQVRLSQCATPCGLRVLFRRLEEIERAEEPLTAPTR